MLRKGILIVMAAASLGSGAWADEDFIAADLLRDAKLAKLWQTRLPLPEGQRVTHAYQVGDQVYVATQDAWTFCLHGDTGVLRWVMQTNTAGYPVWRPCHAGDRVIFVTPASVRQYDRFFGDPIRETKLRFPAGSPAVSDGAYFYIGGVDQRFYSFPLNWDYENWKNGTHGPIRGRPVLFAPNSLAVASDDGGIYACHASDKSYLWLKYAQGPVTADLVADENGIYVASRDQSLYLLDPKSGNALWRARLSGPLYEPPMLTKEVVYQFCPDDGLVAIRTAAQVSGERVMWKLASGRTSLTADEKFVYVLSHGQEILVVRIEDGNVEHTIPAPGFSLGMPRVRDTMITLAAADGRVTAIRPASAPALSPEAIKAALQLKKKSKDSAPAGATSQPVAAGPTNQPSSGDAPGLGSKGPDKPVGGKSKVSKGYGGGR